MYADAQPLKVNSI